MKFSPLITPTVITLSLLKMKMLNISKILSTLWISMMMVILNSVKFMNTSWKLKDNIDKNIVKVMVIHIVYVQYHGSNVMPLHPVLISLSKLKVYSMN
jgi:hypothetical protein